MASWRDQWEGVQRRYDRFRQAIYPPNTGFPSTSHAVDAAYDFFGACYHLKDWLKNDPAVAHHVMDVERFVDGSLCLRICADVCNAAKHVSADRRTRVDSNARIGRMDAAVTPGRGAKMTFWIEAGGQQYEAERLAGECLKEWTRYLRAKDLLLP